jgi:Holliday junction DNA helicase RuvA
MIGHLEGRLLDLEPGLALVESGGVGYEVRVPLSAHGALAGASSVALFIHTHVREDQLALFGFVSRRERDLFRDLIAVAGVGPRTALALLSGLTPDEVAAAVESEQWRPLAAVPGIGRRTAERLVVELKGKVSARPATARGSLRQDAVSALVNLGYPVKAAEQAVADALRETPQSTLEEVLPAALKALVR